MKVFETADIRNIALMGHGGKGKTTLVEGLLFCSGSIERLGKIADGNTVMDFDSEEKMRKSSVSMAVAATEWQGKKINLIDAPGLFDFEAGSAEALRAADTILVVTSAGSGVDVGTEKALRAAGRAGISKMLAITKTVSDHRSFFKTFDSLREKYGNVMCPVFVPHIVNNMPESFVSFITDKAYIYDGKGGVKETEIPKDPEIERLREIYIESVASSEDSLMEKFFNGEKLSTDEMRRGLRIGIRLGTVCPVYAVSGLNLAGLDQLLNGFVNLAPAPSDFDGEMAIDENKNDFIIPFDKKEKTSALCFKTIADPFVGKMSFFKVASGSLKPGTVLINSRTGEEVKIGKLVIVKGVKQEEVTEIPAGDIGVITKLSGVKTGDTVREATFNVKIKGIKYPHASLSMSVVVDKKGDEEKAASAILRLAEEDPTIEFTINKETGQQILSGLGEQHLEVILSKLKNKFSVGISYEKPKVAYREAIRKEISVQGKYKKQSGGHGQYGDVWIKFEPCESEDLIFETAVVGGAVPKNYFPAVEKGLKEAVLKGTLAGFPVVNLKATLYDGSYHPVDSSEMAFKTAASIAFKNAMPQGSPVILEPIGDLKVLLPDENLGDIMGEITKRRGRVLGMGPAQDTGTQEIEAEVPMAEMADFSTYLRSVTAGRASFTFDFVRYEQAPAAIQEKIVEENKKTEE